MDLRVVKRERKAWIKCNPKSFAVWTGISSLPSNDRRKSETDHLATTKYTMSFCLGCVEKEAFLHKVLGV